MNESSFLSQFSPQWTQPEALEKIHVQREDLLAESVEKIRESILTDNKHHLLFVGPRGSGKTHLVTLIHHRLQQPKLMKKARFAWLNEDEIATSFLKLLLLIYRSLAERHPDDFSSATIPGLAGLDAATAEEKLGQALLKDLGKQRTLVVLMENLDALFKHMPKGELLRWRAFVQNHPVFATIGTAQTLFSNVAERKEPFFGFFDISHLEPLSVTDARLLLENIARHQGKTDLLDFLQTSVGKARVSAIHDLAGGNPRLYLIFSDFLDRAALDDLVRPFEEMVDRQLTSYYQERLRWLSPQQREIVQLLCHHGRPIPVKQIAEGLFTTHNSITGQLKPLRDMRYVNFRQCGREVLYELAEPLMRLALQIKETHNRKPLALIVDFLRVWHDREEIEQRMAELPASSRGREYYAETLALIDSGAPNLRHEILRQGLENLEPEQCDDDTLSNARCLAEESDMAGDWIRLGTILNARNEWNEAKSAFTHVIEHENTPVADLATALVRRGSAQENAGRAGEALMDYATAIDLPEAPVSLTALALNQRGIVYFDTNQTEKAISDFTRVFNLPDVRVDDVAGPLINRGAAYHRAGRKEEALADFHSVINLPDVQADPKAQALRNRGCLLLETGKSDDAIANFTLAIDLAGAPMDVVTKSLNNRGTTYGQTGRNKEAIADFTQVIDLPKAPKNQVAKALNNRGVAHIQANRCELALNEDAIDDFGRLFQITDKAIVSEVMAPRWQMYAEEIVDALFAHTTEPSRWSERITEFLDHFSRHDALTQFGDALARHLPKLAASPLNHGAYDAWADAWTTACAKLHQEDQDQIAIPLRLLKAGIEYLKSNEENRLLALPSEERKILRQILELPPE